MKYTICLVVAFSFCFPSILRAQCDKIDSLETLLTKLNPGKRRTDVLNQLSGEYKTLNIKKAYAYAREARGIAENINYMTGKAEALIHMANVNYDINPQSIDETLRLFNQAGGIYRNTSGKEAALAGCYKACGDFFYDKSYAQRNYLDSAINYYLKAYELYDQLNDKEKLAVTSEKIAEVYFETGNEDKALKYSKLSIDEGLRYNKARIISKSLEGQISAQNAFRNILLIAIFMMLALGTLIILAFLGTRRANKRLEIQKNDLALKNQEIERQKKEIEKSNQELQEAFGTLENRNKEIDRQNKEILLQTEELEMRYIEISEKNEEINQQKEEIEAQRDLLQSQAKELEQQAKAVQKSFETLTILSRIGQSITSSLNFKEIFDTVYGYITQLMPAEGFQIVEYHPEDRELEYKFNIQQGEKLGTSYVSMDAGNNPAVLCVKTARVIQINQASELEYFGLNIYSVDPSFNSMLFYPLLAEGRSLGAVGVLSTSVDAYERSHQEILKTLASYTAIALQNAETFEKLHNAQEQLVESEKMAALGNLVAGVAHEINTPVGICVTAASKLETKTKQFNELFADNAMKRKDLQDYLELMTEGSKIIVSNLQRASDLVHSFKRVSVEQTNESKRKFNLKTYLEETLLTLQPELKNKPYEIQLDAEDLEIFNYAGAFSQIITNLVMNSLIHGFKDRDHGLMKIEVKQKGKNFTLVYTDDGKGMLPDVVSQVFEPFFTTNRDGGGTGLGMHIVYNLTVQKLGGKVNCSSEPGKGVIFSFEFPMNV